MNASTKNTDTSNATVGATGNPAAANQPNPAPTSSFSKAVRLGELKKGDFNANQGGTVEKSMEIPAGSAMIIDGAGSSVYVPVGDLTSIWNKNWFRGVAVGAAAIAGGVAGHFGMAYFNKKSEASPKVM